MPLYGTIERKSDGIKPEFTLAIRRAHMDVSRLEALIRVKMETKGTNA